MLVFTNPSTFCLLSVPTEHVKPFYCTDLLVGANRYLADAVILEPFFPNWWPPQSNLVLVGTFTLCGLPTLNTVGYFTLGSFARLGTFAIFHTSPVLLGTVHFPGTSVVQVFAIPGVSGNLSSRDGFKPPYDSVSSKPFMRGSV